MSVIDAAKALLEDIARHFRSMPKPVLEAAEALQIELQIELHAAPVVKESLTPGTAYIIIPPTGEPRAVIPKAGPDGRYRGNMVLAAALALRVLEQDPTWRKAQILWIAQRTKPTIQ